MRSSINYDGHGSVTFIIFYTTDFELVTFRLSVSLPTTELSGVIIWPSVGSPHKILRDLGDVKPSSNILEGAVLDKSML